VPLLALGVATCQLDELVKPPDTGSLTVSPASVQDSAALGSQAVLSLSASIGNTGPGTITWTATRARGSEWLVLGATSGTSPFTLPVTLDPDGLADGVYRDTIVISAGGSVAEPTRVPVTFTIYPCHATPLAAGATVMDSLTPSDCAAPHAAARFARLYRFTAAAGDSVTVVVRSQDFDAFALIDSSASGTGAPLAEGDNCRGVTGDACLPYILIPDAGEYRIEVTSSLAGEIGSFTLSLTTPTPPAAPSAAAQLRADGATAISTGATVPDTTVQLRAVVSDPDLGAELRFEVEVRPVGTPFTGAPTDSSPTLGTGDQATLTVHGLLQDTDYRWQYRAKDETGRTSAWTAYGGNGDSDTDFRTAIPQAPLQPMSLAQLRSDASTPVALGEAVPERTMVFSGTISDPDQGELLRLEVEIRPVGVPFTGVPTGSSVAVSSGQTAAATIAGLNDDTDYRWRARTIDQSGLPSAWVAYGGNPDTDRDFRVAVPATRLDFGVQPSNTVAGATIVPAVTVRMLEATGIRDTSYSGTVTVVIASGTGDPGAMLSGATMVSAVGGVATFADLALDRAATGYALTATAEGVTGGATSAAFAVTPAPATALVFAQEPSNTVAQQAINPPVLIAVRDSLGNTVTSATTSITIALGTDPTGSATLFGTRTVSAEGGVAEFSTLSIDHAGVGYTITANGGSLPQAVSTTFDIQVGTGNRLVYTVQPSSAQAGAVIAPPVEVEVRDAGGNLVSTADTLITLVIANNPGSGTLSGTTTGRASGGVATFDSLRINNVGTGYTLAALGNGLISATSAGFDISAAATTTSITSGAPTALVTGQPDTVTYAVSVTPPGSGTPTGTVTVTDGTDSCTAGVAAGVCAITFTSAGTKSLTATYGGDANFAGSESPAVSHVVRAVSTAAITNDEPDPSTQGQAVTVTYTVTSTDGTPTGDVTVSDGVNSCVGTVATGSCQLVLNTTGARSLTASYAGDGNFAPATSASVPHQVNPLPTVTFTAAAQSNLESVTPVTATVQLSAASGQDVTVPFGVGVGSTATGGGVDYTLSTATPLTIPAGGTTATISLTINGDGVVEADETVVLNLGSPTNATLGSPATHTVTIQDDDVAPPAPTITSPTAGSLTNDNTPTITGTAQVGATVEVFDGVASLGTTVATGGAWTLTPAALTDGSHTVTAQATDGAGNTGPPSSGVTFTVDATAPAAPVVTAPTGGSLTNDNTPTITGTAEPNASVAVLVDAGSVGTVSADGAGVWTYTLTAEQALTDGSHTVTARATDVAGNTGPLSAGVPFTVDATAPSAPVITSPSSGSLTSNNTPTITGTAEANASVAVLVDAASVGTVSADGAGVWTYTLTAEQALTDGSHTVTARATDAAGNTGPLSAGVTFTVDATAPAAPVIDSPTEDELVSSSTPTIAGTAEGKATVTIVIDGGTGVATTAKADGSWKYTVPSALAPGTHTVIARATDSAGNVGADSATRTFYVP
jgi:hypothetical protein